MASGEKQAGDGPVLPFESLEDALSQLPGDVHIMKFRRACNLKAWKEAVERETNFKVQQDEDAFYLEEVTDPAVIRQEVARRDPANEECNATRIPTRMFRHRPPPGETQGVLTESPGAWWCLAKQHRDGPSHALKRALQFAAWAARRIPLVNRPRLAHLTKDCVVMYCDPCGLPTKIILENGKTVSLAPRDIECHYKLDCETKAFEELQDKWPGQNIQAQSTEKSFPYQLSCLPQYVSPLSDAALSYCNVGLFPMQSFAMRSSPMPLHVLFLRQGRGYWSRNPLSTWSYEEVQRAVQEEASQRGLAQYFVEYVDHRNMPYEFCEDNCLYFQTLMSMGSPAAICLQEPRLAIDSFRERDHYEKALSLCEQDGAISKLHFDPAATFEAVQKASSKFRNEKGLDHCVLGFQRENQFQELTEENMESFISSCHKDQPDPEKFVFPVLLRPVYLSLEIVDSELRPPHEVPLESLKDPSEVFTAIDSIIKQHVGAKYEAWYAPPGGAPPGLVGPEYKFEEANKNHFHHTSVCLANHLGPLELRLLKCKPLSVTMKVSFPSKPTVSVTVGGDCAIGSLISLAEYEWRLLGHHIMLTHLTDKEGNKLDPAHSLGQCRLKDGDELTGHTAQTLRNPAAAPMVNYTPDDFDPGDDD